jgi:hypothetical protein
MNLQEVFNHLTGSEFSQLSIGGAAAGVIDSTNYSKVVGHINLGLSQLFTRFNLKERRLKFPVQTDSDTYQLQIEDLLKIERVLTDGDVDMALNQASDTYSCFTPSLNTLRVPQVMLTKVDIPDDLVTDNLTVVYRANHPVLVVPSGEYDPALVELELPRSHLIPLLYFVASRVHNPAGMTNEFHTGNSYYAKYEAACQELEAKGIQVDFGDCNTRLERGGWV